MQEFILLDAYGRFVLSLSAGLFAFSLVVGGIIDHFFTEFSIKEYRLAHRLRGRRKERTALDVQDISLTDLASQLTYGRMSRRKEAELHRGLSSRTSSRTYRSLHSSF